MKHMISMIGLVVLAVTALGCASSKPIPDGMAAYPDCQGRTMLAVHNHTGYEVEIVQTRIGSGAALVVATVGPGYRVLDVETGPEISYGSRMSPGGETISATSRPRVRDRRTVELRYICR